MGRYKQNQCKILDEHELDVLVEKKFLGHVFVCCCPVA